MVKEKCFFLIVVYALLSIHATTDATNSTEISVNNVNISAYLKKAVQKYNQIDDYTCLFHKKEMIGNKIIDQKNIFLKYRRPKNIYMKWTEGEKKGSEVLYAQGKYKDKVVVKVKKMSISVDPNGFLALKNNRHPVTEIGIGHLIDMVQKNYSKSLNQHEGTIQFEKDSVIDGRKVLLFKAVFPENQGYYAPKVLISLDAEWGLPLKIEAYDTKDNFLAMYAYTDIKFNVGLSEKDFDKKNPAYSF